MGRFVKGDVVVLPFPLSDWSGTKRRPALVVAELQGDKAIRGRQFRITEPTGVCL